MYMHKLTWGFVYHYVHPQINMGICSSLCTCTNLHGDLFIIMHMHKLTWGFVYHYVHAQINMGICLHVHNDKQIPMLICACA